MDERSVRHDALRRLLGEGGIANQSHIAERMRSLGFSVTQSSISRDLREIGASKINGSYALVDETYREGSGEESFKSLGGLVDTVEAVGANLVVIRTKVGAANIVAHQIDSLAFDGLAGTIAGDDTIFVATRDRASQARILEYLQTDSSSH